MRCYFPSDSVKKQLNNTVDILIFDYIKIKIVENADEVLNFALKKDLKPLPSEHLF